MDSLVGRRLSRSLMGSHGGMQRLIDRVSSLRRIHLPVIFTAHVYGLFHEHVETCAQRLRTQAQCGCDIHPEP